MADEKVLQCVQEVLTYLKREENMWCGQNDLNYKRILQYLHGLRNSIIYYLLSPI